MTLAVAILTLGQWTTDGWAGADNCPDAIPVARVAMPDAPSHLPDPPKGTAGLRLKLAPIPRPVSPSPQSPHVIRGPAVRVGPRKSR
jgi:hypothetical protein